MTQALAAGRLDMAVLSTDGAVAEMAQGEGFKIVSPFVVSPLRYGVFVWADQAEIETVGDLEGKVFAVSRKGSLSHVMTYLHAQQGGWNPRNWDRTGMWSLAGVT
jgi:ABC-type nitrate/sulfonate/bicarbonate transport system substrate-binding protein